MPTRFNRKTAAVLSGVAASLLVAANAAAAQDKPVIVYAQPPEDVRSERVSYADLDLTLAAGKKRLVRRVAGAVQRVCLYRDGIVGLQATGYYRCADGAWADADPQIARAVARADQIAQTGKSTIAAAAITISAPAAEY